VKISADHRFHLWLLLFWVAVGLVLRLLHLTDKTLWTDEFATMVFSLGHSFYKVPLDQVISAQELLQPLQPDDATVRNVVGNLLNESNHPPLYFILTHLWLKLFPTQGLVSVWGVRSLSVLFGVLAIPAMYGLGWLAFRSRQVAHIAAVLMAVSPFGVYLAQEARHYTLPVLWGIISLGCLILAARSIRDRTPLSWEVCAVWVAANGLGIATHFFFAFTLAAEAAVMAGIGLVQSWRERGTWYPSNHWLRIWAVAGAAVVSGLVCLPFWKDVQDSELTRWIFRDFESGWGWLVPIGQTIAGWITMLYLLPIQTPYPWLVVLSGMVLIGLFVWTLPKFYWGLKVENLGREKRLAAWVLEGFVGAAVLLFWGVTYYLNADLTSAFRYNFVYFPAVVMLTGVALSTTWDAAVQIAKAPADAVPDGLLGALRAGGKKAVVTIVLLGLVGSLTVVFNLSYQKIHRPDVVAAEIQERSAQAGNILVAIAHRTHGQTGRMMGIAWDLQGSTTQPLYLLAHHSQQPRSVTIALRKALNQLAAPLDLWLINFQDVPTQSLDNVLQQNKCESQMRPQSVDGYRYRLYRCNRKKD
jgi:uncharacterized membrane protein